MKKQNEREIETDDKNYSLKSESVETLVNADSDAIPEYSQEELNRYRAPQRLHITQWAKILLIKAWFAGAVCFFILWGLGLYIGNMLDMLFVLGIVLGMVNDVLVNGILRFMEPTPGANSDWMFFPKKGLGSFFGNLIYAFVIITCVYFLYNGINMAFSAVFRTTDKVYIGVEPFLFGLFCMGFDVLFVWLKNRCVCLIRKSGAD